MRSHSRTWPSPVTTESDEVARALGDLLADEGQQQPDRPEAEEHHDAGREAARHPDPAQPDDHG